MYGEHRRSPALDTIAVDVLLEHGDANPPAREPTSCC